MKRRWLFRGLAAVGIPLFLFSLVEGGVRVAGVGNPVSFWTSAHVRGKVLAVDNPYFSWRFFGPRRARLATPFALERPKPDGVTRVFVLGGSAAQGDPDPSFSMARFLEVLLSVESPEARFEVVNAAMTAIDSTVVRTIAADLMSLEPDLLVLYVGNNEIVGPFGPNAGGLGRRMISAGRRWLLQFRLIQWGAHLADEAELRRGEMEEWLGLEAFSGLELEPSDSALVEARIRFEDNIEAILDMAQEAAIPVILCTVGVNLADNPPFSSGDSLDFDASEREKRDLLIDQAMQAALAGDYAESLLLLGDAAQFVGRSADIEFLRAKVLMSAGRQAEALEAFKLSRDMDRLRFRADSTINRIIRKAAEKERAVPVVLADVETAMEKEAMEGVPGRRFFFEHVHLTFEGTAVVAREVFRALEDEDFAWPLRTSTNEDLLGNIDLAHRLALTGWSQARMSREILGRVKRPPFTKQLGHQSTVRAIERDLESLVPFTDIAGIERAKLQLVDAVEQDPDDWFHAYNLALLFRQIGDENGALQQLRRVLAARPTFSMARRELGRALLRVGQPEAAVTAFRRVVDVHPYSTEALADLGVALVAAGRESEALEPFNRALKLKPENVTVLYHLALAQFAQGEAGRLQAIEQLQTVLNLDPTHRDAVIMLRALEDPSRNN